MSELKNSCSNTFEASRFYTTEVFEISAIRIDPSHPRKITKKQIEKAARFIRAASWVPPVLIDRSGYILAGGEWYEAALLLGMEKIQVIVVDALTETLDRTFRIAYVRIMEDGAWDNKNLAADFRFLIESEFSCDSDFTVEFTGFETAEIDLILNEGEDEPDLAEAVPDVQKIILTKPGDIWKLDKHTIICGDSLDPAVHERLLDGLPVQLLCSDPPFNVKIDGFVSGNGAVKHDDFAMASGELTSTEFEEFLFKSISNSIASLDDGACCYLFQDWRHDRELQAAARRCGLTQLNLCIWDKGVGGMGSFYRSQHELIFVYRKGKLSHRNNIQLGKYGRNRTNVWAYPSANMSKEGRKALKDHPTPKPVVMIADIIRDVTKPNDVILDPFLGGGTAVIAAEKTSRRCFGIELDPRYVDVTIRRWQDFTGKEAIHAETGLTFSELAEQESSAVREDGHEGI